jgi:hypothetical protein
MEEVKSIKPNQNIYVDLTKEQMRELFRNILNGDSIYFMGHGLWRGNRYSILACDSKDEKDGVDVPYIFTKYFISACHSAKFRQFIPRGMEIYTSDNSADGVEVDDNNFWSLIIDYRNVMIEIPKMKEAEKIKQQTEAEFVRTALAYKDLKDGKITWEQWSEIHDGLLTREKRKLYELKLLELNPPLKPEEKIDEVAEPLYQQQQPQQPVAVVLAAPTPRVWTEKERKDSRAMVITERLKFLNGLVSNSMNWKTQEEKHRHEKYSRELNDYLIENKEIIDEYRIDPRSRF